MKKIISILFLFCALGVWSQANDSIHHSKWEIGFTFSPDATYRILKTGSSDAWLKNIYDTMEVSRFGFTAGLNMIFRINKNFSLASGVLLADKGEKTKTYQIQPINNYTNHYYYLDVPVKSQYYLLHKTVKLFLSAGISANIYISSQSVVASGPAADKRPLGLSSGISPLGLSFLGGFGMDCPITDRWYFKLEPNYRRSITPIADAPIKKYFYSFGLNVGLFCKL